MFVNNYLCGVQPHAVFLSLSERHLYTFNVDGHLLSDQGLERTILDIQKTQAGLTTDSNKGKTINMEVRKQVSDVFVNVLKVGVLNTSDISPILKQEHVAYVSRYKHLVWGVLKDGSE